PGRLPREQERRGSTGLPRPSGRRLPSEAAERLSSDSRGPLGPLRSRDPGKSLTAPTALVKGDHRTGVHAEPAELGGVLFQRAAFQPAITSTGNDRTPDWFAIDRTRDGWAGGRRLQRASPPGVQEHRRQVAQ